MTVAAPLHAPSPPLEAASSEPHRKLCDVAVIGGGPAGSAAAITLARAGIRVVLIERARFPRFHVGESLLPFQQGVLERLGVADKVARAGFVEKFGGFILANDGSCESPIDFEQFLPESVNHAYQVDRAEFDEILLRHAEAEGAEVLEEHSVAAAELGAEACRLTVRNRAGGQLDVRCRWVIDASGQQSFLARKLGIRRNDAQLQKVALFAHYRGGRRRPGKQSGHINLILGDGCWFWHIPLRGDRASVGCVLDHAVWQQADQPAELFLAERIASCPWLADFLSGAERVTPTHTVANFSYTASRFTGPGWTLAGDAATFLDPVFSTGVLLALQSGEEAARALIEGLRGGDSIDPRSQLSYEKKLRRWTRGYDRFIRCFYHPEFASVIFNPVGLLQKPIVHFLAGKAEPNLVQRVAIRLFLAAVAINRRLGLNRDRRSPRAQLHHG